MRPARKAVYSCLCLADPGAVSSESFSHCGLVSLQYKVLHSCGKRKTRASRGKKSEMSFVKYSTIKNTEI